MPHQITAARRRTMNYLRTAILLAGLTALFMGVGYLIGGSGGAMVALLVAAGMKLFAYWNSDRMVLSMYGAGEVDPRSVPDLYALVQELVGGAGLPMPRVYIIDRKSVVEGKSVDLGGRRII